jgi:hypothetical protein
MEKKELPSSLMFVNGKDGATQQLDLFKWKRPSC